MKVGLDVLLAENPVGGQAPSYAEIRDLARRAERAGFYALWLYDHLLYRPPARAPRGIWECGGRRGWIAAAPGARSGA